MLTGLLYYDDFLWCNCEKSSPLSPNMAAQRPMTEFLTRKISKIPTENSESAASEPPEKRILLSTTADAEKQVQKHVLPRNFRQEWLSQFHWLRFDDITGNMHCDSCCRTGQDNPMVTGCTNFRTSTLTRHQESNAHTQAIEKLQLQKHFKKAVKNVETKNEETFRTDTITKRHMVQIRTAYVMAQNGIPANNFTDLMELQKANGCENADIFYSKPEVVGEMELVLSDQIEKNLIKDITNSPFFGIMLDETCSVRNKQLPDCPTQVEIPSDNLRLPCACPSDNLKFWSVFLQFRSFSVISFTFYPVQLNAVIKCIRCNEHSDWVDVIILTNQ